MKNYIMLKGRKIELTNEQVKEIEQSFSLGDVELSTLNVGETFKVGDYEFIVLEHSKETTAVILKDLLKDDVQFGKNNNFHGSNVYEMCNDLAKKIERIVGKNNVVAHTVDLTSDDGLKDYGKITCKASLLTTKLYRRYVEILDKHKLNKWWWLATAYSTPTHSNNSWAKCVSPSRSISGSNCNDGNGVRPFCILKSNIFVSK